jgi:protein-tyrosine-phosphatase
MSSSLMKNSFSRRNVLCSALVVVGVVGCAPLRRTSAPTVLFVCEFGTTKSAIARELFRRRAAERGLAVAAFSRGLKLENHISPQLKRRLDAEGIDPARDQPQVLEPADWRRADVIVAFNTLPAGVSRAKIRDWTDLPSMNDDYANARAMLDRRIEELIGELLAAA